MSGVLRLATVLLLITGCVGAPGTRARAYAIDGTLAAIGGVAFAAAVSKQLDSDDTFWLGFLGLTTSLISGGGLVLTGIGAVGESQRSRDPVVAVRPWTPREAQVPFDAGTNPEAKRALDAAAASDCEHSLSQVDALWRSAPAVHAQLVKDPKIALCIATSHTGLAP